MRQDEINYVGVFGTVGGLLGFMGIYLNWWTYSFPVSGGVITVPVRGLDEWSAMVALIAGLMAFAFGGAYVLMDDPGIRKITGALMGIGAILLLGMSVAGLFRADAAVGPSPLVVAPAGAVVRFATGVGGGIFVSILGGVVAVIGTIMMVGRTSTPDASGTV